MLLSLLLAIFACIAAPLLFVRALQSFFIILAGVCLAVIIGFYCWATGRDDPLDDFPDPDCIGAAGFEWVGTEIPDAGSVVINGRK